MTAHKQGRSPLKPFGPRSGAAIPLPSRNSDLVTRRSGENREGGAEVDWGRDRVEPDKDRVIAEAFRVLKPGGRFAVSDVVVRGDDIPAEVRRSLELWVGCVAGALEESTYRSMLSGAGFEAVDLEPTRIYRAADARQFLEASGLSDDSTIAQIDGRMMSAFVRARKPAAAASSCCGPTCCS